MSTTDLELTAHSIVANGKGILAADALQDEALAAWGGRDAYLAAAQRAFYHRARCDFAAAHEQYSTGIEAGPAAA